MELFNEANLRQAIVDRWGEYGAHILVYDHLVEMAKKEEFAPESAAIEVSAFHNHRVHAESLSAYLEAVDAAGFAIVRKVP